MNNWTVDIKQLKKHKEQYIHWRLEQLVNFGLGGEKINAKSLKTHWKKLRLDPKKKRFLSILLWPQKRF
ncbi:MAG TPA: hypothetical protein VJH75_01315 [Patescibacteria group bacterium]|nr:hypothetical protein [Patescibacteria group bacterium]